MLRNHYSVPLDAGEMLVGQMEKGDLVFILHGLDKLGEKLSSVLDDIQRTRDMETFKECYFLGCFLSTTDSLIGSSPLCRVIPRPDFDPTPSIDVP